MGGGGGMTYRQHNGRGRGAGHVQVSVCMGPQVSHELCNAGPYIVTEYECEILYNPVLLQMFYVPMFQCF